jgi:peptide/nickel transport system permease protein
VIDLKLSQNDLSADKLSRNQLLQALGLDRPMAEQYLRWWGIRRGDSAGRRGNRRQWSSCPF